MAPAPKRGLPRKRPELLLAATALLGAAAALVAIGAHRLQADAADAAASPAWSGAPETTAATNPFEEPSAPQTTGAIAYTQTTGAIGYTQIVAYYTDSAGGVVVMFPDEGIQVAASVISTDAAQLPPTTVRQPTAAPPQAQYPVNINTAAQEQLETLPGIGPVKAQAILAWRAANGRFAGAAQLLEVKGIGEKTLEKLLPYIIF
ncbi:MAG: ComEA family DNA-binding protein [Oscillospiraceae bacterium]|jgi:competence protein ComEA|nr:ComEA family DNA-binding protein [Oscillospiraceae bacterium]